MESHWADLINSDWHDHLGSKCEDLLDNDAWLKEFLGRWQWSKAGITPSVAREQLRKLRILMARIVKATVAGKEVSEGDWKSLNQFLAAAPLVQQMQTGKGGYCMTLLPLEKNLNSILAEIALSFTRVFVEGDPARIRICENEVCLWVFYDQSKNRTRRWCAASCGNLIKVRRFRERKKRDSQASKI